MAIRRKGRAINAIVLVDKSQGDSSNNILQKVRAIFGAQKAGHTGALDPLATGMLPVCLGEATKFSQYLLDSDKTYFVTAKLGERTDTSDADGEIIETNEVNVTEEQILEHKTSLTGDIKQVPTMFSALKHQGKPLYWYARQGITVEREARPISIFSFELKRFEGDEADFVVHCSKGTYIRTLIDDLGQLLGCGAHVKVLRRTKVANYPVEKMLTLEQIQALKDDNMDDDGNVDYSALDSQLLPMETALDALSEIKLPEQAVKTLRYGQTVPLPIEDIAEAKAYMLETGEFVGVVSAENGEVKSKRLVVTDNFL
jgi:tRNA pseudouridine55 synthase